jgi:hypothetical protein
MKFKVHVGKWFEVVDVTFETTEKKVTLEKIFAGIAIFVCIGLFSAAAYGAVSGDYVVFESLLDMLYKVVRIIVER